MRYKKIWLITVDSIHKPYTLGIISCMDNTAGSLTQLQKSFIVGTLLGDGYIRQVKGRKNAFLEVNHSITQKEYVEWKYQILKNLTRSGPKLRKGNGSRIAYRFFTKQHPEFTKIMDLFSKEDQYKLLGFLRKVGLEGTLNRDKEYYRIRFKTSSISQLFGMIEQHIIPSMKYKIGL